MGSYSSKFFTRQEHNTDSKVQQSAQSIIAEKQNEYVTPIAKRTLPIDPRSVSAGISRTPIEITRTPPVLTRRAVNALPKYLEEKPYLETNVDVVLPPLSPKLYIDSKPTNVDHQESPIFVEPVPDCTSPTVNIVQAPAVLTQHSNGDTPIEVLRYKILGLDPRSPAVDFDRTPILKPKSFVRLKARSQENLARRGSYTSDVYNPRLSYCETTTSDSIPEIQALPDIVANLNRASSLGNCTTAFNESDSASSDDNSSTESTSDSSENITVIHNSNVKFSADFESIANSTASNEKVTNVTAKILEPEVIPEQTLIETAEDDDRKGDLAAVEQASEQQFKLAKDENKIEIWKDLKLPKIPLVPDLDALETLVLFEEIESSIPKEEIIIEFDDNEILKNVQYTSTQKTVEMQDNKLSKQGLLVRKKKNIKTDNRITVDEKKLYTADWKSIVHAPKNRAPLGNRSNNSQIQDMMTKSPQQLLRNKTHASKVQQENTPPHKKDMLKSKLNIQWDPDSTIVI